MRKLFIALALLPALAMALGPGVAGKWLGKFDTTSLKLPKAQNAQQAQMMEQSVAALKQAKIILTLKPDKTYTVNMTGMKGLKDQSDSGTWSQAGSTVTVFTKNKNQASQKISISKDGRSMTMLMGKVHTIRLVFRRA